MLSPADDCTQRADCLEDAKGTSPILDSSIETSIGEQGGEGGSSPDVTRGDALDESIDSQRGDAASSTDDASLPCTATGPEVCNNGIDDDCNGKIDCADPACSAFSCASPLPVGWLGPVAFWQGAAGVAAPACPQGFAYALDANSELKASATTCRCSCAAEGQVCAETGAFYGDQNCATAACATLAPAQSGACTELASNACGAGGSFALAGSSTSGGSCAAQVTSTIPTPQWSTSVRLCSYPSPANGAGGCADTVDPCLAPPSTPFAARPCVYAIGSAPAACPAGYNAVPPAVFYAGFSDDRACGPCTCSGPTAGSCSGTVALYGGPGCIGTSGTAVYSVGAFCQVYSALSPSPGSVRANYSVTPGTCAVESPPSPTGILTPTSPVTVCCM